MLCTSIKPLFPLKHSLDSSHSHIFFLWQNKRPKKRWNDIAIMELKSEAPLWSPLSPPPPSKQRYLKPPLFFLKKWNHQLFEELRENMHGYLLRPSKHFRANSSALNYANFFPCLSRSPIVKFPTFPLESPNFFVKLPSSFLFEHTVHDHRHHRHHHHQIQPLMDWGLHMVCTPTPKKSLVCPPPEEALFSSLWVMFLRFAGGGYACKVLSVMSSAVSELGIWFDPKSPQNLLSWSWGCWPSLLLGFNRKLPKKDGSVADVAPICAAFCKRAVADMFAGDEACWWCWVLYSEGTLRMLFWWWWWFGPSFMWWSEGGFMLMSSQAVFDGNLLPNTQLLRLWSNGGGLLLGHVLSAYKCVAEGLFRDPSWWISCKLMPSDDSWGWEVWTIHRESPPPPTPPFLVWWLIMGSVLMLLEIGLNMEGRFGGMFGGRSAVPMKW